MLTDVLTWCVLTWCVLTCCECVDMMWKCWLDVRVLTWHICVFVWQDEQISQERVTFNISGGCTALVTLVLLGRLYVAHAGDGRWTFVLHTCVLTHYCKACIFRVHVFFANFAFFSSNAKYSCREMFRATHWKQTMKYRMPFPVLLIHAHGHTSHCYSMLRIESLYSRLVFRIQPKINKKIKNRMNLHYLNPRTIPSLSVRFKYTVHETLRMSVITSFDAVA